MWYGAFYAKKMDRPVLRPPLLPPPPGMCALMYPCSVQYTFAGRNYYFASTEMVSSKPGVPLLKGPQTETLPVPDQLFCQTPAPAADPPVQQVAEAVPQNNTANVAPTPPEPTRKQGRPRRTKAQKTAQSGPADSGQGEVGISGVNSRVIKSTDYQEILKM